jgi:hypothetical protein
MMLNFRQEIAGCGGPSTVSLTLLGLEDILSYVAQELSTDN